MFELRETSGALTLCYAGRTVLRHTKEQPFLTAVDLHVGYRSKRGTFTIRTKQHGRIPLTQSALLQSDASGAAIRFTGDGVVVNVQIRETDGALQFHFDTECTLAVCLSLPATPDEAIFGGGEQFRQLNLRGEKVTNFVSEHSNLSVLVQKTVLPKFLYRTRRHGEIGTYAPMSTFVSSAHYALRFDVSGWGESDFTQKDRFSFLFRTCPRGLLYAVSDSFAGLGRRLNSDIPNREFLPEWCYDGMILGVQGGIDTVMEKAFAMQDMGAAISGVWCQDWSGQKITAVGSQVYWNWEADAARYHDLAENIRRLKERSIHFLAYINPYLVENGPLYNACKAKNLLIRTRAGEVYHIQSTTFNAGMLDLTNPDAVRYIKDELITKNMLELGVDGYMADFGEYLPVDCVLHDGDPELLHNEWPVMWSRINREAVDAHPRRSEIFFFTRAAYNGAQAYTTMMWNGDQHTDRSFDYGLPTVMPATFSLGFSGVTATHCDVGGFFSFGKMTRDGELYVRWMELCAFSPLMRGHESIRPQVNAQYDAPFVAPYTVELSRMHRALRPYLVALMREANAGVPAMRPDFYEANEFAAHRDQYAYLLGADLFVAPVLERGVTKRTLDLPEGDWVHLFTGEEYASGRYTVDAPLGRPPVFYRKGSSYTEVFKTIQQTGR